MIDLQLSAALAYVCSMAERRCRLYELAIAKEAEHTRRSFGQKWRRLREEVLGNCTRAG